MTKFIGDNVKIKKLMQVSATAGMLTLTSIGSAAELGGVEFSGSGFMTIGVGTMLSGTKKIVSDYNCPCFVADYAQGAVYDNRSAPQFGPDSKLGLQGTASYDNRRYSITAQAVSRGAQDGRVNLEWLYASYKINNNFTLQGGRKRLPMFYYSDTQDIGVALPWTHLPPQLYGWEAVNYNGLNLAYQGQWGDWSASSNLLAGNETREESGYWKIYQGRKNRTDVKWSNIFGADLSLSNDWLETRVVYIQSDTQTKIVNGTWDAATLTYDTSAIETEFTPKGKQQIYGLTVNMDYNNWLVRSEIIQINHPGGEFRDTAQILGSGYRFGKWQPMVTYARYQSVVAGVGDPLGQEGHATVSLTLRYDLTTSSVLKAQLDNQRDHGGPTWEPNYGNSQLLTFTYDTVF
ncbi:MAG: hypothetical protein WC742_05620 [Gallionellaceae bacterium]|jgi:hypothetical protein